MRFKFSSFSITSLTHSSFSAGRLTHHLHSGNPRYLPDNHLLNRSLHGRRRSWYHTNGDNVKRDDPYHVLGLSYADGATTSEIREAFQKRAKELHPDLNQTLSPEQAHKEFQRLLRSYEALTKFSTAEDSETVENWRRTIWRQSDQIALDRTDVAGLARKRPAPPASTKDTNKSWKNYNMIGHPQGLGSPRRSGRRDEYLGDGTTSQGRRKNPSSVGRGQSKWVTRTRHNQTNRSQADNSNDGSDNNGNGSGSGGGGYQEWDGTTIATKASNVTATNRKI